jgi:hypothetical protein
VNGGWRIVNGEWRIVNGEWRMTDEKGLGQVFENDF